MDPPTGKLTNVFMSPEPENEPVAPPLNTAFHPLIVVPIGAVSVIVVPKASNGPALLTTTEYIAA